MFSRSGTISATFTFDVETVNLFGTVDIGKLRAIHNHHAKQVELAENELEKFLASEQEIRSSYYDSMAVGWELKRLKRFHALTATINQARFALTLASNVLLKFEQGQREVSVEAFLHVVAHPYPSGVLCEK
jgi:hypothetical protein